MSAPILSAAALAHAQQQFAAALPAMHRTIANQFRRLSQRHRAEAVADGVAAAWHAWHGLVRRGKDLQAVGPTGVAYHAAMYVRNGRCLGTGTTGRGAMDVFNPRGRKACGYRIVSLDRGDEDAPGGRPEAWLM